MPSLADKQPTPAPIVEKGDSISSYIIILIILIIFIIFWCWIAYVMSTQPPTDKLLFACVAGQCGTNMFNGEKRCPVNNSDVVLIDPAYEVCNSKYTCENPLTPFALQSDGSTNNLGVCEPNSICRCLNNATCGSQVTSLFQVTNGSLYSTEPGGRFSFQQIPITGDLGAGNVNYEDSTTNFCSIKASNLNRLSPGSCTFDDSDFNDPKGTVLVSTNCINSNPCVRGVMAFNTSNPSSLEINGVGISEVFSIPVTCINANISCDTFGIPCPNNVCPVAMVPYWDERWGLVRCALINYPPR